MTRLSPQNDKKIALKPCNGGGFQGGVKMG